MRLTTVGFDHFNRMRAFSQPRLALHWRWKSLVCGRFNDFHGGKIICADFVILPADVEGLSNEFVCAMQHS
jgi:hypothetical protein